MALKIKTMLVDSAHEGKTIAWPHEPPAVDKPSTSGSLLVGY